MKTFGASAPLKELQKKFGFSAESLVAEAKIWLENRAMNILDFGSAGNRRRIDL